MADVSTGLLVLGLILAVVDGAAASPQTVLAVLPD
jgi:hypothetical protein